MFPKAFLKNLYHQMLRIRLFEESLVEPILSGIVGTPCHLYSGEEAIAVGVSAALKKQDIAFGYHRSHGHYLAKGGEIKKLMAEIYGKETGCSRGRGGSMHVIAPEVSFMGSTPMVAGTVSLAVGAALSAKIKREKRAVVSFFGDGATSEGILYESLNIASLYKLPVLFACENNFYSTHLPLLEFRAADNIWEVAKPFKILSFRVNGNDVLKVFETAKKARDYLLRGKGPVFVEFRTYRLRGHVGPDDNIQGYHTDVRPKKEIEQWKKKDPLILFERVLKQRKVSGREIAALKEKAKREVQAAHIFAQKSAYPKTSELQKYVFA